MGAGSTICSDGFSEFRAGRMLLCLLEVVLCRIMRFGSAGLFMIYVARADGKVIGKFSEEEFRTKIAAGDISPDDRYLGDGTKQWLRASQFPGAAFPQPNRDEEVLPGLAVPVDAKVCTNCGYIGRPVWITKGSFGLEVLLWLVFLVPGLLYSVWRVSSRYAGCPKCKASNMIPGDSPVARKFLSRS